MQDIKKIMGWIFASTCVLYVLTFLRSAYVISRDSALLTPRNLFFTLVFEVVVATTTAVAAWTILGKTPTAKVWGIAASLMYILIFLRPIVFSLRSVWLHHAGALVIGIVGLITFLLRDEHPPPARLNNNGAGDLHAVVKRGVFLSGAGPHVLSLVLDCITMKEAAPLVAVF